jgi:hypothetical protein
LYRIDQFSILNVLCQHVYTRNLANFWFVPIKKDNITWIRMALSFQNPKLSSIFCASFDRHFCIFFDRCERGFNNFCCYKTVITIDDNDMVGKCFIQNAFEDIIFTK